MEPSSIMQLFFITSWIFAVGLLTFLLPKKVRKFVWAILGIILICSVIYQGAIKPLIIEQKTGKAIEVLEGHLEEKYPIDSWIITDTDDYKIKPVITLHVIFDSEPKVIYEYIVENTVVRQVDMWTVLGNSVEESGIEPQHAE
ncbi:hypothetical protein QTL97_09655 [Sporosarcina thermotolerans]|uniref:DUF3139 domain-containing protein n=1 Tax=Sporosarcina thermotolerans TaxID=633404 RepID=A0AAW9A7N8_9BACL|nr:hypothetical protein [Sporosarcina thermotolerans]MDW0117202.1 hypothetical protein [Sporosarcina thermotolerans]WHT47373.1 hypothetical protein QNH10_14370 [Sporosarcina thermotolerans]